MNPKHNRIKPCFVPALAVIVAVIAGLLLVRPTLGKGWDGAERLDEKSISDRTVDANAELKRDGTIRIGVLANRGVQKCFEEWEPTASYLAQNLFPLKFEIIPLGFNEIITAVRERRVSYVVANSSYYALLEYHGLAHRIATLQVPGTREPLSCFGGVIFTRADRSDIVHLRDLRRMRFAAVDSNSMGGWHAAMGEMIESELDPYGDFSSLTFEGTHDAVVKAVLSGLADAGTVRSTQLERMAREGTLLLGQIRVINSKSSLYPRYPYLLSTRLYPEWPFAALSDTDSILSKRISIALLKMDKDDSAARSVSGAGWTIPQDYAVVHELLRVLRLPPYERIGEVTIRQALRQYWPGVAGAVLLLLLSFGFGFRVTRLNRKIRDIAESLRESEEKFRALVENANDIIYSLSSQGIFTYVSPNWTEILGHDTTEVVGKSLVPFVHPDDMAAFELFFRKVVESGKRQGGVEYRVLHKNGTWKWHTSNASPKHRVGGTVAEYVGVAHDITMRREAEERIRALLAEKEVLLKEVHHRLKNNMNTVKSILVLQAETLEDGKAKEALKDAGSRVQSMAVLYDKLYRSEDLREMPVADYLSRMVDDIVVLFPNGHTVTVVKRIGDFAIDVKKMTSLGIMLNELVTNAMKHAFNGNGKGQITVEVTKKNGRVTFIFEDNGCGIPGSVNLDDEATTGFGLRLVGLLAGQLKGVVRVDRGMGARFVVEFDA